MPGRNDLGFGQVPVMLQRSCREAAIMLQFKQVPCGFRGKAGLNLLVNKSLVVCLVVCQGRRLPRASVFLGCCPACQGWGGISPLIKSHLDHGFGTRQRTETSHALTLSRLPSISPFQTVPTFARPGPTSGQPLLHRYLSNLPLFFLPGCRPGYGKSEVPTLFARYCEQLRRRSPCHAIAYAYPVSWFQPREIPKPVTYPA